MLMTHRIFGALLSDAVKDKDAVKSSEKAAKPKKVEDWSGIVSFEPKDYPTPPKSIDELKELLTKFHNENRRIRVLGSLHSCSDIYRSDAVVDVSKLQKDPEFNSDNSEVTVSANCRLHDFLCELSKKGKSLPATGGTDHQTLAGLISTNTAPATSKYGMYEGLDWVKYVTIDKNSKLHERCVKKGEPGFQAMVCSLGAIGVLTELHFKVIDEPYYTTVQKIVPLDDVLKDVANTSNRYDFWRIDWLPNTQNGLIWTASKCQTKPNDVNGDYPKKDTADLENLDDAARLNKEDLGPLYNDGKSMKWLYNLLFKNFKERPEEEEKVTGPLRNMLPVDRCVPLRVAMAEWSFDPDNLQVVKRCCEDYFEKHDWPNMPIEIELSKTDDYFMSPWNWAGLPYIVKFNFMYLTSVCDTPAEQQTIRKHLHGLWNFLLDKKIKFKAHWGKINFMDHEFVRNSYELEKFEPFICDDFLNNDYLAKLLRRP